jgi:hypothetical protein
MSEQHCAQTALLSSGPKLRNSADLTIWKIRSPSEHRSIASERLKSSGPELVDIGGTFSEPYLLTRVASDVFMPAEAFTEKCFKGHLFCEAELAGRESLAGTRFAVSQPH